MNYENSLAYAQQMDAEDPLKGYRSQFHMPQVNGRDSFYFTGNSLGLQPKTVRSYVEEELKGWETLGVEGHFALNTLAPYMLIQGLRPQLSAGASDGNQSVIINFSSSAINAVKEIDVTQLRNPDKIGGLMDAYAKSKQAVTAVRDED